MTGTYTATLVERVREGHAKAMEALAADVHPYSGPAIRNWEEQHDDALTELEERLKDLEKERDVLFKGDWAMLNQKLEAAEADIAGLCKREESALSRARAAEREREKYRLGMNAQLQLREAAEARVSELQEALRRIADGAESNAASEVTQVARAALAKGQ